MKDRDFLCWLHERLEHIHKENPLFDYMHKLRSIIATIPPNQETRKTSTDIDKLWTKEAKQAKRPFGAVK